MNARTLILLSVFMLLPILSHGQTFLNTDHRSGLYVEPGVPGIGFYHDERTSGLIVQAAPGITYFNFSGKDAESGFAVDLSPRYQPLIDPMPPLPRMSQSLGLPRMVYNDPALNETMQKIYESNDRVVHEWQERSRSR